MKTVDFTIIYLSVINYTSTVFNKIYYLTNMNFYDNINYNKGDTLCLK